MYIQSICSVYACVYIYKHFILENTVKLVSLRVQFLKSVNMATNTINTKNCKPSCNMKASKLAAYSHCYISYFNRCATRIFKTCSIRLLSQGH